MSGRVPTRVQNPSCSEITDRERFARATASTTMAFGTTYGASIQNRAETMVGASASRSKVKPLEGIPADQLLRLRRQRLGLLGELRRLGLGEQRPDLPSTCGSIPAAVAPKPADPLPVLLHQAAG